MPPVESLAGQAAHQSDIPQSDFISTHIETKQAASSRVIWHLKRTG